MMNNEPSGVVTRQQSLKQQQQNAANETAGESLVDANNNEKTFKDRNVPFMFDPSAKFTYLNSEQASDQENDQENAHARHKNNDKKVREKLCFLLKI